MRTAAALLCFVAAGPIAACAAEERSNPDTGAAAADMPAPEAPEGRHEPASVDILRACDVELPCGYSSAQIAERSPHLARENFECLMLALASRKPGRYEHLTDDTNGFSSTGTEHVLVVSHDGAVRYASSSSSSSATAPQASTTYHPGERCTLQSASYFEACAAAVDGFAGVADSPAWACAFGELPSKWFERCDEAPLLSCE